MRLTAWIMAAGLGSLLENFSGERGRQLMPILAAMAGVFLLMVSLRRRQRQQRMEHDQRQSQPAPREPSTHRVPQVAPELYRDLNDLIVELQELSRRISAEIDTRFAKLEAAMRDADRRIAVLHRLNKGPESGTVSSSGTATNHDSRHAVVYELADAGFSAVEIARELGKTPGEVELILNLRSKG